ncbi:hypothetical protein ACQR1I_36185 [Bradyrhizobium sp. HKCCYLS2038]|uniref:hypothetical protein n=1 Tax=Bradyrhizobium sp. HKCCYLS2038 TaxID=3420764 RepID=UPI003EBD184A
MDRKRCERARRDEGFPARLDCDICGRGPCGRLVVGQNWPPKPPHDGLTGAQIAAREVPNRLFGATINENGEAV